MNPVHTMGDKSIGAIQVFSVHRRSQHFATSEVFEKTIKNMMRSDLLPNSSRIECIGKWLGRGAYLTVAQCNA
jgi:hypothetical protein